MTTWRGSARPFGWFLQGPNGRFGEMRRSGLASPRQSGHSKRLRLEVVDYPPALIAMAYRVAEAVEHEERLSGGA